MSCIGIRTAKCFEHQERSRDVLRCVVPLNEDGKATGTTILTEIDLKNTIGHIHIKMSIDSGRGKGYKKML